MHVLKTGENGNAYFLSLTRTNQPDGLMDKDYYNVLPTNKEDDFYKSRFYFARMDNQFRSSLSNYRETRDDSYWHRHLNFVQPLDHFFAKDRKQLTIYDVEPFGFGTGIDYGRTVLGLNAAFHLWNGTLKNKTDWRNVHRNNNKFIENEIRTEFTYQANPKLKTKALYLNHNLPVTVAGEDPFITDPTTGLFLANTAIQGGEDRDLETISTGVQYDLNKWLTLNGIWEYTNESTTLGSDNFPRGILNDSSVFTFSQGDDIFRRDFPFLYSQNFFDLPPYDYYNILKFGMHLKPRENLNFYIDYTRNPNEFAGQIDSNINHLGFQVAYAPTERLGFFTKYTWSQLKNIDEVVFDSKIETESHHNLFAEARFNIRDTDKLVMQYGVGPSPTVASASFDPFGGSLITLDTQHVTRLFYTKYF